MQNSAAPPTTSKLRMCDTREQKSARRQITEQGCCAGPELAAFLELSPAESQTSSSAHDLHTALAAACRPVTRSAVRLYTATALPRSAAGKLQRSQLEGSLLMPTTAQVRVHSCQWLSKPQACCFLGPAAVCCRLCTKFAVCCWTAPRPDLRQCRPHASCSASNLGPSGSSASYSDASLGLHSGADPACSGCAGTPAQAARRAADLAGSVPGCTDAS